MAPRRTKTKTETTRSSAVRTAAAPVQPPPAEPPDTPPAARSDDDAPDLVQLGSLARPWGRRGELTALLHNPSTDLFDHVDHVLLAADGEAPRRVGVRRARWVGKRFVLQLEGVDEPDAAEALRGQRLSVEADALPALDDDEVYVRDLLGLAVVDADGRALGTIRNVFPTGSNDVYVVHGPGGETLIPAIPDVVLAVDLDAGRVTVDWQPLDDGDA